jgi:sigma-B regulation protein RsbU (phosphoserine phosphatase)
MRIGIRTKIILAIGIPLLLVYLVMIWILVDQIRSRGLQRLEERAVETASEASARVGGRLALAARSAQDLAGALAGIPGTAPDDRIAMARAVLEQDPLIHGIRLIGPPAAGAPVLSVVGLFRSAGALVTLPRPAPPGPGPQTSAEWADEALHEGRAGWTEPFQDPEEGEGLLAAYVTPVVRDNSVIGAVRIDILLKDLRETLGSMLVGRDFALVSRTGRFLIRPAVLRGSSVTLPELVRNQGRADLMAFSGRLLAGQTGLVQAEGLLRPGRYWIVFAPVQDTGWFFIGSVPESLVLAFSRGQLHLALAILGMGLAVIVVLLVLMASRITRPVERLAAGVAGLGGGNLDTRVSGVESRDELGDLAAAFNRMVADLKHHVEALGRETAAREKVEGELRVARQIQTALLPKKLPRGEDFDLHAVNLPARRVAGDFYDCFLRDDKSLVFLIADVSGKGVPAALFMAVARTVLREVLASGLSLSAAVERANELLEKDSPGSMYITLFVAVFDLPSGTLTYVNGGHPAPYRLDSAGRVSPFGEVGGPMVGLLAGTKYPAGTGQLEKGDRLVLFTDGVPEATDPTGEFFGDERFVALLGEGREDDAAALCKRVSEQLEAYQEGNRYDDLTLLVLGRRPYIR